MNTVTIGRRTVQVPSEWNELTREQLIYVAGLFARKMTQAQFRVHLLWKIARVKMNTLMIVDPDNYTALTGLFDWVLKDVTLTRNLVKKIGPFFGPADAMTDCTFGEFTRVHMKMEDYARSNDERDLDELVAILYREEKWMWWLRKRFTDSADCRVRFIEKYLPARAGRMAKMDPATKYAVFLMVNGVVASLPEKFPNVYRSKGGSGGANKGWATLIMALADGHTDDESLDKVFYSNMYNVFMGLENKALQYFEDLKRMDTHD